MDNIEIVNTLLNEGSRFGFGVLLIIFYLRITSVGHEKATAQARLTADNAIEDLKEFRILAKEEIADLKSDLNEVRDELATCKAEALSNLETYQKKLMEIEEEAHTAKLEKQTLEVRVQQLERKLNG